MLLINSGNFNEKVVESETPVVVDFFADWCQPCRMIATTLEKLAKSYGDRIKFVKVNAEEESDITSKLRISALPTLLVYKGGQMVKSFVGLQSEKNLRTALDACLQ